MAYDEDLAARLRSVLADEPGLSEKRMFGGLAFLVDGRMAVAAGSGRALLLRVDPAESESLLDPPLVERFEMRGRPMAGWLHVQADAVPDDEALQRWAGHGVAYARTLPPKQPGLNAPA